MEPLKNTFHLAAGLAVSALGASTIFSSMPIGLAVYKQTNQVLLGVLAFAAALGIGGLTVAGGIKVSKKVPETSTVLNPPT